MACCKNPTVEVIYLDPRYNDPSDQDFLKLAYASPDAAAMDLRAAIDLPEEIAPGAVKLVPTGVAINMPTPYMAAHILPRSGLGHKHGIVLGNLVGEIDSDYQGQLFVSVWNRSDTPYTIAVGERIAQIEFVPILRVALNEVTEFSDSSERGAGGFGSSGRH